MDNGLNSINSTVKKIKAIKIKAIKKLENGYSDKVEYFYDRNTGVVYDFDLKFPIGKVYFDEDGIPEMKDHKTYIISEIIPIPILKTYDKKPTTCRANYSEPPL